MVLASWLLLVGSLTQAEFDKLTADDNWEPTQAQFARMDEEQRGAIREHSNLLKVNEDTRHRRMHNDVKEQRLVDTADLKAATTKLLGQLNKHIDEIAGTKIPLACFGRETQAECTAAAAPLHKELKEQIREACNKFGPA